MASCCGFHLPLGSSVSGGGGGGVFLFGDLHGDVFAFGFGIGPVGCGVNSLSLSPVDLGGDFGGGVVVSCPGPCLYP